MATHRRAMILTAFLLQLLMVGATASPLADSTNPLGDVSKMNADLAERLDEAPDTTVIPVIFQLNSPVTPHDRAFMADLGLNLMGEPRSWTQVWWKGKPLMSVECQRGTAPSTSNLTSRWNSSICHLSGAVNPNRAS